MEKPEKRCENCRYFLQHYIKQNSRFFNVCCGHCINQSNKKMTPLKTCEFWEDIAIAKEERKRSIMNTLEFMSERLNEIAIILSDDR